MKVQLMCLAVVLQDLFTSTASFLAACTHFICRRRQLSAPAFVQTLVFRWLANPNDTLENMAAALRLSPQALQQHCNQNAIAFLQALIAEALHRLHNCRLQAHSLGLLDAFAALVIDDTTTVSLPASLAALFPGCGGSTPSAGAAAVKILLRYELKTGRILRLTFHAGRTNDAALAASAHELPAGALYLADMAFFDAARLGAFGTARSWISRVPASTSVAIAGVWQALWRWLKRQRRSVLDVAEVLLAESVGTACRLVALPCPPEVTRRRRQKLRHRSRRKQGREPSERCLALCAWTVLATNVAQQVLAAHGVWVTYRCRWQIELLFKRAKGLAGWSVSHGRNGQRVLVELLAKVLGLLVLHWGALLRGGPLMGVSMHKRMVKVAEYAGQLRGSIKRGVAWLEEVLGEMLAELRQMRPQRPRKRKPGTRDILFEPGLAA
jgi:hypothetical protein